jgi:retron-type reverse transcriptase
VKTYKYLYPSICDFENIYLAYRKARRGKRGKPPAASFERVQDDGLLALQNELQTQTYRPGAYHSFYIHEPKRRLISAAPFRDRIVHHALCRVIEPIWERRFIHDSYANRVGKGNHRALDRCTQFARKYRYVLQCDVRQFFPSVDHEILCYELSRLIRDDQTIWLIDSIIKSGVGVLSEGYELVRFPGDNLLAAERPRGLPIGNLTSQFWANVYMNTFDQFVKREMKCPAYIRYVDDMLFFGDDSSHLSRWKQMVIEKLAELRLTIHEQRAQVYPVATGIPFLGFRVYPDFRWVKRKKVVSYRRRIRRKIRAFAVGSISFSELDASVRGWVNHVRYADSWGLRKAMFRTMPILMNAGL